MGTAKKPATPKAPKSVEDLIAHALKLAAANPKAKWTGASAAALFNTKEANVEAAIAECTKPDAPLLKKNGAGGTLTAAGAARAEMLTVAATAAELSPTKRVAFLQDAIGRTPDAAAELIPLLERATAEKAEELRAETELTARRAAARDANRAAYERALELLRQDHENEVTAARQWWQALGQKADALPAHTPPPERQPEQERERNGPGPEPRTAEEKDFRRSACDRLAAAWRDALRDGKTEGAEYLETAMWNIRGMRMIGEVDVTTKFDGRIHESDGPAFTDYAVKVVRPGWLLKTDDEEYVALKAAVTPV